MNKLTLIISLLLTASTIFANDVNVEPMLVRSFSNANEYRMGLRLPMVTSNYGLSMDAWMLTETPNFESTYLGAGLSQRIVNQRNFTASIVAGYSANFNNIHNPRGGSWSYGLSATVRF